ncbi:C-type lectin 37Da-like [Sitophilus oryzae]|uniref:C-type lectin 37Da-like n=1 Tax=Sitophilus oryzae TaxID=7048 RepID=A0A6J2YBV4_SITOR|nr:C-type lectin 37Da-like [Sitophilus oryzae]
MVFIRNNITSVVVFVVLSFEFATCQKYVVVKEPANWFQSLINCKSAGMELASVNSKEETNRLQKFLTDNGYKAGYWLAGTKLGDGQYYWATTGAKVVYTNWLVGQPDDAKMDYNNNEGEHCIQLGMPTYSPEPNGWNDVGCHSHLPYICQSSEICYESNDIL